MNKLSREVQDAECSECHHTGPLDEDGRCLVEVGHLVDPEGPFSWQHYCGHKCVFPSISEAEDKTSVSPKPKAPSRSSVVIEKDISLTVAKIRERRAFMNSGSTKLYTIKDRDADIDTLLSIIDTLQRGGGFVSTTEESHSPASQTESASVHQPDVQAADVVQLLREIRSLLFVAQPTEQVKAFIARINAVEDAASPVQPEQSVDEIAHEDSYWDDPLRGTNKC